MKVGAITVLCTLHFVLIFSCGQKKKPIIIPANIIQKEKMSRVLTDIHLEEAQEKLNSLPDTTKAKPIDFQKIFAKDTITKQQYEESLSFYIDHPELLKDVYSDVVNELSKMQGATTNKK